MQLQSGIILLIILIALSAFFSGSESAIMSVSRLKVRHLLYKKRKGAAVLKKLKEDPQRTIITILIGNNVVNIAAAAIATKIVIDLGYNYAIGITTGIMTLVLLVFGEVTPKLLATQNYEAVAIFVARPIWILSIIFYPLIVLLNLFVKFLSNIFGIKRKKPIITEEELKSYIRAGEEAGSIKETEKVMIHNIFRLDDTYIKEIMTPTPDMVGIDIKIKIKDAISVMNEAPYSRFPVYEHSKDKIKGILYIKDVYACAGKKGFGNIPVIKLMRKPFFVPEVKKVDSLLRQFQKRKEHMAIVVDEHGIVSGLVTIEDVLEELVGEITDETDRILPNVTRLNKKSWLVLGKTPIEEVNSKLRTNFKGTGVETFGGFILNKSGRIPKENDEIGIDKRYKVIIEEITDRRILKIKLIKK